MEALQCGLVVRRRTFMIISRIIAQCPQCFRLYLLLSVSVLSLLLFFLLSSQPVVLSLWNAWNGLLDASSGFVFLLLNCLIASVIASSRMESSVSARRRHEEAEEETQVLGRISGLAYSEASEKKTPLRHNQEWSGLSSTHCISNDGVEQAIIRGDGRGEREEQAVKRDGSDRKIREEKAWTPRDNAHEKNGAARKNEGECDKAVEKASIRMTGGEERGLLIIRKRVGHCADSSSANGIQEAASAEEVWAAIMSAMTRTSSGSSSISGSISSRKGDSGEQEKEESVGSADHTLNEAVAPASAAMISKNSVAAGAHGNNFTNNNNEKKKKKKKKPMNAARGVEATHQRASSRRRVRSDERPAAVAGWPAPHEHSVGEVLKKEGDEEEGEDAAEWEANGDQGVAELNRRAEEFIARFNQQIRLQRLDSLQRRRCRPNYGCSADRNDVYYQHWLPPAPPSPAQYGLLAG